MEGWRDGGMDGWMDGGMEIDHDQCQGLLAHARMSRHMLTSACAPSAIVRASV
jgi:hypothetical protein